MSKKFLFILVFLLTTTFQISADIVKRSDQGFLEIVDGQQIMHLKGSPYDLGFQHGSLLKEQIVRNINELLESKMSSAKVQPLLQNFMAALPQVIPHIPESLIQEMKGLSDATNLPYEKILLLNLFPEMFHCSAITASGKATANGQLFHVRVLDYAVGASLQETAVLAIVEPNDGYAFLNVTYAGFIGSVTGMNAQKIALGEIGGKGYGSWNGLPMAFLLREILEQAASIDDIQRMLSSTPRTCEYYYIFSDGKTKQAVGAYATAERLAYISPGSSYSYPFCSQSNGDQNTTTHQQPENCIVLTRWSHFDILKERLSKSYGNMTVEDLQNAIKQPVAHPSNLHNAIFAPESLEVWISHAGPNNEPASDQPYHHFCLLELLGK